MVLACVLCSCFYYVLISPSYNFKTILPAESIQLTSFRPSCFLIFKELFPFTAFGKGVQMYNSILNYQINFLVRFISVATINFLRTFPLSGVQIYESVFSWQKVSFKIFSGILQLLLHPLYTVF